MFSLVAHEYAHGYAALKQGDDTALQQGRLTLNPIPHIDPMMTVIVPILIWYASGKTFTFGGARPVQVRPDRYRNFRRGDLLVSSAGIVTNLIIAVACAGLFVLLGLLAQAVVAGTEAFSTGQRMMYWGVSLNLILCFFNLIPIPPLDGSHILYHLLPGGIREGYRKLGRIGFLLLIGLMMLAPGAFRVLLAPAYAALAFFIQVASPFAVGTHWNIFPA